MSDTALSAAAAGIELAKERRIRELPSLAEAYEAILIHTEGRLRDGTVETPERAARGWLELTSGYAIDPKALCKTFDAEGYDEMIAVAHIPFASLCEHHLLPFVGHVGVVYIPNKRVLGLSKIPRIVDAYAHRLQQQERLTAQIANVIEEAIDPLGILVYVEAIHSCAALRGVKKHDAPMRTSVTRGYMRDDHKARDEALALVNHL